MGLKAVAYSLINFSLILRIILLKYKCLLSNYSIMDLAKVHMIATLPNGFALFTRYKYAQLYSRHYIGDLGNAFINRSDNPIPMGCSSKNITESLDLNKLSLVICVEMLYN